MMEESMKNNNNINSKIFFLSTIKEIKFIYIALILMIVSSIIYAIIVFKLIDPYLQIIQNIVGVKGPLLMIMIVFPCMVIYFIVIYFIYNYLYIKKKKTIAFVENEELLIVNNGCTRIFKNNNIRKSVFFVNRNSNQTKWLVIKQKNNIDYIIISSKYDENNFQKFIDLYENYIKVNVNELDSIIGSSNSVFIKKIYNHE